MLKYNASHNKNLAVSKFLDNDGRLGEISINNPDVGTFRWYFSEGHFTLMPKASSVGLISGVYKKLLERPLPYSDLMSLLPEHKEKWEAMGATTKSYAFYFHRLPNETELLAFASHFIGKHPKIKDKALAKHLAHALFARLEFNDSKLRYLLVLHSDLLKDFQTTVMSNGNLTKFAKDGLATFSVDRVIQLVGLMTKMGDISGYEQEILSSIDFKKRNTNIGSVLKALDAILSSEDMNEASRIISLFLSDQLIISHSDIDDNSIAHMLCAFRSISFKNDRQKMLGQLILDNKFNLIATNKEGLTPVDQAIINNNYLFAEILLDGGGVCSHPMILRYTRYSSLNDLDIKIIEKSFAKNTYLEIALDLNDLKLVDYFLSGDARELPNKQGFKPLHLAVSAGRVEAIKLILEKGVDVDGKTVSEGLTALDFALEIKDYDSRYNDIIALLKNYGGNESGRREMVKKLAKENAQRAELIRVCEKGRNGFHRVAIQAPNKQIWINLFKKKLETIEDKSLRTSLLNAKDTDGNTPLHLLIQKQAHLLTGVLLDQGADIEIANQAGKSCRQLADDIGNQDIIDKLNQARK